MPPGSRTQQAIPKLVPAKAGTALEAATHRWLSQKEVAYLVIIFLFDIL